MSPVEKAGTKEGWSQAAPDEYFTMGYLAELEDFATCAAGSRRPQSDPDLAHDTTAAIYAAYLPAERHGAEVAVPWR